MDCVTIRNAAIAAGVMTLVDIATGVTRAALNRELSSDGFLRGLVRKSAVILAFSLAVALEYAESLIALGLDIRLTVPVACYIVLTEATSAYENIKGIDPALRPDAFEDIFEVNREKGDEGHDVRGDR